MKNYCPLKYSKKYLFSCRNNGRLTKVIQAAGININGHVKAPKNSVGHEY